MEFSGGAGADEEEEIHLHFFGEGRVHPRDVESVLGATRMVNESANEGLDAPNELERRGLGPGTDTYS